MKNKSAFLMRFIFLGLSLLVNAQVAFAECTVSHIAQKVELHWADNAISYSPDCEFAIQVIPTHVGDEITNAYLAKTGSVRPDNALFTVFRDGTLYWDKNGKRLAFQDRRSVGVYRLLLFPVPPKPESVAETNWLDSALRKAVEGSLPPFENIVRFWPNIAVWLEDRVLITVELKTVIGNTGPLIGHCRGYIVSTSAKQAIEEVTEADMKRTYETDCPY